MAREIAKNLIHHLKENSFSGLCDTKDLSYAYYEIELDFSDKDRCLYRGLYEWALIKYSSYNPFLGRLFDRPDMELLRSQAIEAIILFETRVDELAMLKAFDVESDSMRYQNAVYWLDEAKQYIRLIAERITFVRELEKNVMKVKSGIIDGEPEERAMEYLSYLYENQKMIQDHMDQYFAINDELELEINK